MIEPVERGRAGRPSKRTDAARTSILADLRIGAPFAVAARNAGLSEDTLREWRRDDETLEEECQAMIAAFVLDQVREISARSEPSSSRDLMVCRSRSRRLRQNSIS